MAAAEVGPESVPVARLDLRIRRVAGALLIARPEEAAALELTGTAMFLFRAFDGSRSVTDLATMLVSEYDVPLELATEDTQSFVADLLADELIELRGGRP